MITTATQETVVKQETMSSTEALSDAGQVQLTQTDVLVELKANLAQLEDLHGRMRFMMGEISYLLKRS